MESRAKLFGHPIHQMFIVFPLGLLATALGFDAVQLVTGNGYWLMRTANPAAPEVPALALAFLGGGLALITGWLGGEPVDRLAVGVDEGANLNAPSSLTAVRLKTDTTSRRVRG